VCELNCEVLIPALLFDRHSGDQLKMELHILPFYLSTIMHYT